MAEFPTKGKMPYGAMLKAYIDDAVSAVGSVITTGRLSEEGLSAAYAAQMDVTGKTTAQINTWLAAASSGPKRMVGTVTINAPLVIPSNTHLDATGAVITLAAGSNCNLLQNTAVVATGTRNAGITIVGGTWARGNNAGAGTNLHGLCFRRVDGLRVRNLRYTSSAGKYGISLGDVTDFDIEGIDFAAYSDGVHINGPARNGKVRRISGSTGDDSVALTGNDYTAYADVSGNITDVHVEDVNTTSTLANLFKVLAGSGCTVDRITADRITGTPQLHGVWIGDDSGQAATTGGIYGHVVARGIKCSPVTGQPLRLVSPSATNIEAQIVYSGTSGQAVQITGGSTVTIGRLALDMIYTGTARAIFTDSVASGNGVPNVTIDRLEMTGSYTMTGSGQLVRFDSGTINELVIDGRYNGASGNYVVQHVNNTSQTIKRCILAGQFTGFNTLYRGGAGGAGAVVVFRGTAKTPSRIAAFYHASAHSVILAGGVLDGPTLEPFYASAASLTVSGSLGAYLSPYSGQLIGRPATETIRLNAPDLAMEVDRLTPADGDMATNTKAALGCGTGKVVYNTATAKWKHIYTGLTT